MPFDGSGNYSPAPSPNFPAIGGTTISAAYYNAVINDIAGALSNVLTRDGQGRPTANIDWNAKNLTNVATLGAVTANISGNLSVGGTLDLASPLPVTEGGTGGTTSTGSGAVVLQTSPTITNPVFNNPTAVGGVAGNAQTVWRTTGLAGTNALDVSLREERAANGSDWTTTRSRLTTRVDVANLTYIDLRTDTNEPGIAFGTGSGGNPVERMRITQAGNVGIGIVSPNTKLELANAGFCAMRISGNNTSETQLQFASNTAARINQRSAAALTFDTDNTERMRISAAGNVGIGTTSPATALHVAGSGLTLDTALSIANGGTGATTAAAARTALGAGTVTSVSGTGSTNGLSLSGTVTGSGNLTLGGSVTSVAATATIDGQVIGFRDLPARVGSGGYTIIDGDRGRMILMLGGVTIPANATSPLPLGSTVVLYNNTGSPQTISITSDTLRLAGTATTGSRTVAQRGFATCVKVAATEWVVSGNVT